MIMMMKKKILSIVIMITKLNIKDLRKKKRRAKEKGVERKANRWWILMGVGLWIKEEVPRSRKKMIKCRLLLII